MGQNVMMRFDAAKDCILVRLCVNISAEQAPAICLSAQPPDLQTLGPLPAQA